MDFTIFQVFMNSIRAVLNADTGFFVAEGQQMALKAGIIALALFGIDMAIHKYRDREFAVLVDLVFLMVIVFAMSIFYNQPIPQFGVTFPGIVTTNVERWSREIGWNAMETIIQRSSAIWGGMEHPSIANLDILGIFNYLVLSACFLILQVLAVAAVLVGLFMEAVLKLVGPLFIPFLLIPRLDRLFWGWFMSFLGFSFIQVIAAACLRIAVGALVPAMNVLPPHMSMQFQAGAVTTLAALIFTIIYVFFKIPTYTNMLFSGSSGGGLTEGWWRR